MTGDLRAHDVDGWPAQMFGLPASWYAEVNEHAGVEFPVNADETTHRRGLSTK
jgi:hypothetical protein